MNTEQDYWSTRMSEEGRNLHFQHDSIMNKLYIEEQMALFSSLKPKLSLEGNQWLCLYGDNIQEGICGFGDSPYKAILAFNIEFNKTINPY